MLGADRGTSVDKTCVSDLPIPLVDICRRRGLSSLLYLRNDEGSWRIQCLDGIVSRVCWHGPGLEGEEEGGICG